MHTEMAGQKSEPHDAVSDEQRFTVEQLYEQACREGTTYEAVVHARFCAGMTETFGDDEDAPSVAAVFKYARRTYGYLSDEENAQIEADNADARICIHGMDYMTCPRGCF